MNREIKFRAWNTKTKIMDYFDLEDLTMSASESYLRNVDNVDMLSKNIIMQL